MKQQEAKMKDDISRYLPKIYIISNNISPFFHIRYDILLFELTLLLVIFQTLSDFHFI